MEQVIDEKKQLKLLIASDLHGSAYWTRRLVERFQEECFCKLVLLGDILYHGPRNDLPRDYNPKQVIEMLSPLASKIICVKGNCEAEVDQMVLPFDVSSEYATIFDGEADLVMHLHHGHNHQPPAARGDAVIAGHTHVPVLEIVDGIIHLNPGSVSIPKGGSINSYAVYQNQHFSIRSFNGTMSMEVANEDKN